MNLPLLLLLTGCFPGVWAEGGWRTGDSGYDRGVFDQDGDGLVDSTDPFPTQADGDADYLNDLEERIAGTNPADPDSDADGYLDGDEVLESTDPMNDGSRIYTGRWPYFRDKDTILGNTPFSGPVAVGAIFPRFDGLDQHGQVVDLYDFAEPTQAYDTLILATVAEDCAACQTVHSWLAGGADPADYQSQYPSVRAAVDSGSVRWITVVSRDAAGSPGGQLAVLNWATSFPHANIPVLSDGSSEVENALGGSFPMVAVINAQTMLVGDVVPLDDALLASLQNSL